MRDTRSPAKRAYRAPRLEEFGSVSGLTAGSSYNGYPSVETWLDDPSTPKDPDHGYGSIS